MKQILIAFGLLVLVVVLFVYSTMGGFSGLSGMFTIPGFTKPSATVTINNQQFRASVAKDQKQKQIGLSKTNKLADNEGMLFVFDEKGIHSFWMRDMKFPIDIIFIDDNKVVYIEKNAAVPTSTTQTAQLPIYRPKAPANYVFEINAGLSDKYGLKEGDVVQINGVK